MNPQLSKYEAYFGRAADFILEARQGATPCVTVGRFPPVSAGFLRRFVTPVHDRVVYVTCGMSCKPMRIPEAEKQVYPSAIELIACCKGAYAGEREGTDIVAIYLQALAALPFEMDIFFGPMHTAALEERLSPNSEMSAFFFALPDGINMSRLCSCTPAAQLVVSVMPITTAERSFANTNGSEKLVALFQQHRVPNLFDPFRRSVV
jgi:hypothetical protein